MDKKKLFLIIGALIIAFGAAFGVNTMIRGAAAEKAEASAAPKVEGPEILVAVTSLPVGTIIREDAFRFQPWPAELMKSAYFVKGQADLASLAGTVVRHAITAGQPVTQGALVQPGDRGFLAAALGPGMRAVTVKVNDIEGVAGFVFPGDRVDMLLTQRISVKEGSAYPDDELHTSETIVRNLRVLATDQRVTAENEETKQTEVAVFNSVTIEVTPEIAEKIALAQQMGKLSLALRPIAENVAELESAIASGAVNVPTDKDGKAETKMLKDLETRPVASRGQAMTGGDVSRFWVPVRGRVNPMRRSGGGGNADAGPSVPPQNNGPVPFMPSSVGAGGGDDTPRNTGPTVRVVRGDRVTEVPVEGN